MRRCWNCINEHRARDSRHGMQTRRLVPRATIYSEDGTLEKVAALARLVHRTLELTGSGITQRLVQRWWPGVSGESPERRIANEGPTAGSLTSSSAHPDRRRG